MKSAKRAILNLCLLAALFPRAAFGSDHFVTYQSGTVNQIPNSNTLLPNYLWALGCCPTSAAMVMGYWDNLGLIAGSPGKNTYYGKLINHYTDNATTVSGLTFDGDQKNQSIWGDFHPDLLSDLASAMHTSSTGGSPWDMIHTGINTVASNRGYSGTWSTQYKGNDTPIIGNDWNWSRVQTEINGNRPFVWSVAGENSVTLEQKAHCVAAWGYTDTKYVIVYNTWDELRRDWYYARYDNDPDFPVIYTQVDSVWPQGGTSSPGQDVILYTSGYGQDWSAESWKGATQQYLRWYQFGSSITNAYIRYSSDGGLTWTFIAYVTSASGWNSYAWTIPNTIDSSRMKIKVEGWGGSTHYSGDGSQQNFTITPTPAPNVSSINPTSTSEGGLVIINGYDFGAYLTSCSVKFYNNITASIVSWSDTQIKCIVPTGAASGNVTVTTLGGSDTASFTLGYPESPHNYPNSVDFNCVYILPGNPAAMDVTFDVNTYTEPSNDWIYVGGAYKNIAGSPFTGSALAGQKKRISEAGGKLQVRLVSGSANNYYGFKVTLVEEADLTPPPAPTGVTATPSGWTNINSFSINWTNPYDVSGIAAIYYYKLDSAPTSNSDYTGTTSNKPFTLSATVQGGQYIYIWLQDGMGNTSYANYGYTTLYYDNTAPSAPISLTASPNTWTNTNSFSINWTNPADASNVVGAYYKRGSAPTSNSDYGPGGYTASKPFTVAATAQGSQSIYVWLQDSVGNKNYQYAAITTLYYDGTAPSNPTAAYESHGITKDVWQNTVSDPAFTWSGASDTGGSSLKGYSVYWGTDPNGEPGTSYEQAGASSDPAAFSGAYYLRVRTFDNAGNKSSPVTLFTAKYDGTAPSNPTAAVESHGMTSNVWQNTVSDPSFTWSGAADTGGAGVKGYSVYWGTDVSAEPGVVFEQSDALYDPGTFATTYYLRVRTFDNAGNKSGPIAIFTAKYDGTPPSPPVLNETDCGSSWTNHNSPLFSWTNPGDSGGSGTTGYYGSKNGGSTFTVTSPYAPPAWTDGEHTFKIYAVDGAGNQSGFSNIKTVKIDTQLPVSACAALAQYLPALFTVQWSGTDPGDSQLASYDVQSKAGAGAWTDWVTNTTLTAKTFGPAPDSQTYYFRVRAKDAAGNVEAWPGTADAFTTVDASSPTTPAVSSTHQVDQWNFDSNSPQFNWTASDPGAAPSGIMGYSVALDRSANFVPGMVINLTGTSTTFTNVADGTWYFYARAKDNGGNWGASAKYGPVRIDINPPAFLSIVPSKNPAPEGSLAVTIVASEQLSVISATVTQNAGGPVAVPLTSQDNITWTGSYAVASGFDGTAAISVSGKDVPGKEGFGSAAFTVDTIVPSKPSITSATHPENTPKSNSAPGFTWSLSADTDGSGVAGYSYAFNQLQTYNLDTTTETAATSVSSSTADGVYWFHLRGADNAGNGSEIVRYKFIVDTTSPVYITAYSQNPAKAGQLALTVDAGEALANMPTVSITQNGGSPAQPAMTSSDNAVWTGNYTVVPGYDGAAAVTVTGIDLADNTGTGNSSFQADTIEPSASITLSPSGTLKTGPFTLTLEITDATPINESPVLTFSPPGQQPVSVPLSGSDKSWTGGSFIESVMSTGAATFNFSAADAAGNTGTAISAGDTFTIDTAISSTTGGTVTNSDDTGVVIGPGAYDGGSLLVIIGTPDENRPDIVEADRNTPGPTPVEGRNLRREFSAKNSATGEAVTTFSSPITLSIYYPDADNDGLVDGANARESKLKLFWLNANTRSWDEVLNAASDFALNKISASVTHFSVYSILTVAPESTIYPIPWKPGSGGNFDSPGIVSGCPTSTGFGIIFDNLSEGAGIRIYNYQGDLLRELKLTAADNGCTAWDGKNAAGRDVASGIYLALIKMPSGGKMIKKLAIER